MSAPVYIQSPFVRNRPMARKDAQSNIIPSSFADLSFRGEYSGANLTYRGLARPGADEADSVWQLSMFTYDGSGNLLSILWPQDNNVHASSDYSFIWANRTLYTYA